MSKRNGKTKTATFVAWYADCGEEVVDCGADLMAAHSIGEGYVMANTTAGIAQWFSGFTTALPGDKVVLRKRGECWFVEGLA